MQSLTFTNARGQSVTFGNSAPFLLSKLRGTGGVSLEMQTTKSLGQDGSSLHEITMENRVIEIEGYVIGSSMQDMYAKRKDLVSILNPKLGQGLLTYSNDFCSRQIQVLPEESPVWGDRMGKNNAFTVSLIGHNPFWTDTFRMSQQMNYLMGGLTFPLRLPTQFSTRSYRKTIPNTGDAETPVEIEFYGPAINPTIINNTTGEYITVKRNLGETDKLTINTEFGNKSVEIEDVNGNRTNAFNWIDLSSTFFQLQIGDNVVEYNSNNDSTKSRAVIKFFNRYLGV